MTDWARGALKIAADYTGPDAKKFTHKKLR